MVRLVIEIALVLGVGSACSNHKVTDVCPADLRFSWSPRDTTITVGDQFTIQFSLFGCAGTKRLTDDSLTFTSSNPAIATVERTTGVVTGIAPGADTVAVTAPQYDVGADVVVIVQ